MNPTEKLIKTIGTPYLKELYTPTPEEVIQLYQS